MFMNDCTHRGGIRIHAIKYLSNLGLSCSKIKEQKPCAYYWGREKVKFTVRNEDKPVKIYGSDVFTSSLSCLPSEDVELKTGQVLPIPTIIQEMCETIMKNVETEGIFEKRGSRTKQHRIQASIDVSGRLKKTNLNPIDVASVLRLFLRTLPEPLIPYAYHNLFLACCKLRHKKREVLMIATLLLPIEHLNLLTYLMQFFKEVTTYSEFNKMTKCRLAMCISKDILPVCKFSYGIFDRTTEVTWLLIKESSGIGLITKEIRRKLELDGYQEYERTNVLVSFLRNFKRFLCIVI